MLLPLSFEFAVRYKQHNSYLARVLLALAVRRPSEAQNEELIIRRLLMLSRRVIPTIERDMFPAARADGQHERGDMCHQRSLT